MLLCGPCYVVQLFSNSVKILHVFTHVLRFFSVDCWFNFMCLFSLEIRHWPSPVLARHREFFLDKVLYFFLIIFFTPISLGKGRISFVFGFCLVLIFLRLLTLFSKFPGSSVRIEEYSVVPSVALCFHQIFDVDTFFGDPGRSGRCFHHFPLWSG